MATQAVDVHDIDPEEAILALAADLQKAAVAERKAHRRLVGLIEDAAAEGERQRRVLQG